jgi:hypothetical protein
LKYGWLVLFTLLSVNVIKPSFAVITLVQTPTPKSFVGYGGEIMLPLLDGANFSFYIGEELWVMATGETMMWLSSPDGNVSDVVWANLGPQMLKAFTEQDSVGSWSLGLNTPEGPETATIDLRKYAASGPAELSFNLEGDNVSTSIEKDSQSLAAFVSEGGSSAVSPGETVGLEFGTSRSGLANIRILSGEEETIEGKSDNVSQIVEVSPLVANFTVEVVEGHLEFNFPKIHEVGPGGLFPLRYGSITVEASPLEDAEISASSRFYMFPVRPYTGAKLSNNLELAAKDAFQKSFELTMLDQTSNATLSATEASSIFFTLPLANVHIVDERHGKYLMKEDFILIVDGSQVWYDNDSAYVLYSQKASITKENTDIPGSLTYELKIRGFTCSEGGPTTISLKSGESVFITTKVCELKLLVEDLYGNPLKADMSINDTVSVNITGEATLNLPFGHYSLEVYSDLGNETRTADLENDTEITFKLGHPDPILIVLTALGVTESAAIAIVAFFLRRRITRKSLFFCLIDERTKLPFIIMWKIIHTCRIRPNVCWIEVER